MKSWDKNYLLKTGLVVLLTTCQLFVLAQNQSKADSLKVLIEKNEISSDSLLLEVYHRISTYSSSPEEVLRYGKELLALAQQKQNDDYTAKAHLSLGVAQRLLGNLSKSFEHLFKSADIASKNQELSSLLSVIYAEIATSYTQNNDTQNAMVYGRKTIDILRKTDRQRELAMNLLNMGYDYYLIEQYDSALNYYLEAEVIFKALEIPIGQAYTIGNKSLVFWKRGKYDQAKDGLFEAVDMLEKLEDKYGLADYYNKLGHVFMEESEQSQAIKYATLSLQIAEKEGLKEVIRDASYLLYLLNQNIGSFEKALAYHSQYHAYKDSIQNLETTQRLANLRTQYEVGQKQVEVDRLLEQERNNRIIMITGGIVLVIVTGLVLLIFYYYKAKSKLNQQLRDQKDSLVTLNNTKDRFFSIISHDLRGPVGVLRGLLYAINRNWDDMDRTELKDILDQMEGSAGQLVKLLDNLLHWALQQKGHFPYTPETLSLKRILTEVTDLFSEMAASKNIALQLQMDADITIMADNNATLTIFRNLMNNALKFTSHGGEIQVIAEVNSESNCADVKIIDNGVGIPQDKLDVLFELNENISTRGTSGESGLGLGLQLVYEFVQLNKGAISVSSEEQKGTTFIISLPLSDEALPVDTESITTSFAHKYN